MDTRTQKCVNRLLINYIVEKSQLIICSELFLLIPAFTRIFWLTRYSTASFEQKNERYEKG